MSKKATTQRGNPLTRRSMDNSTVLFIALAAALAGILIGMLSLDPVGAEPAPVVDIGEPATLERELPAEVDGFQWVEPGALKQPVTPTDDSFERVETHDSQTDAERGKVVRNCPAHKEVAVDADGVTVCRELGSAA